MKKIFLMFALMIPMVLCAQKFGHVNQQEVFSLMPELKQVQQKMDTLQGQYETQIANMREEYSKKITEYQQNEATMVDAVKTIRQQEIAEMEQRIQLFYQTAEQDIQAKQREWLAPVHTKLTEAIQKVGADNGYTYIFDSMAMAYISASADDVTPLVKSALGIK